MRKYITLIFALALLSIGLNAQSGRRSGMTGGINSYIETTDFDSIHVVAGKFVYGTAGSGQEVTATGVELNYLDLGALGTGAASKAVVLDTGDDYIWPATGFLTYWGTQISATGLEINVLDGIAATLTFDELDYLDIATPGTGAASKAVVLDAGDDYTWPATGILTYGVLNDGTTTLTTTVAQLNAIPATTATAGELDYNAGVTAGTGLASKSMVLDAGEDFVWPSGGVLTYGGSTVTSTGTELSYTDITTLGTQEASKVVTTDGNVNSGVSKVTQLWIGATGSEIRVNATPAEIDRVADKSTSVVDITGASVSITLATHGDRIITLNRAAGITVTLDAATGTGASYTFIIGTSCTSGNYIIKVANGTDVFDGSLAIGVDIDGEGATGYVWFAVAGDDTFTMPAAGPVSGGEVGDVIRVTDYAAGFFLIEAHIQQGGASEATPFTSGV